MIFYSPSRPFNGAALSQSFVFCRFLASIFNKKKSPEALMNEENINDIFWEEQEEILYNFFCTGKRM